MKGLILSGGKRTRLPNKSAFAANQEHDSMVTGHERWWRPIKDRDPEFRKYYQAQYGQRS